MRLSSSDSRTVCPHSSGLRALELDQLCPQRFVIFLGAGFEREVLVAHDASLIYQVNRPLVDAAKRRLITTEELGDRVIVILEQREIEFMMLRPFLMREDVIAADRQQPGV